MTTELTLGMSVRVTASGPGWADRRKGEADGDPRRSLAGLLFARGPDGAGSRSARLFVDYWQRRALRTLTDDCLRDAGIDPTRVGRH